MALIGFKSTYAIQAAIMFVQLLFAQMSHKARIKAREKDAVVAEQQDESKE